MFCLFFWQINFTQNSSARRCREKRTNAQLLIILLLFVNHMYKYINILCFKKIMDIINTSIWQHP